jgi:hypothetical protein
MRSPSSAARPDAVLRAPVLRVQCKFGTLVKDERCGDIFEALVGTLRAAKKRKVIAFEGEMLLQGAARARARKRLRTRSRAASRRCADAAGVAQARTTTWTWCCSRRRTRERGTRQPDAAPGG